MSTLIKRLVARFRLKQAAICEMSKGKGLYNDYHDYPDTLHGEPFHFVKLTCRHCGKDFCI